MKREESQKSTENKDNFHSEKLDLGNIDFSKIFNNSVESTYEDKLEIALLETFKFSKPIFETEPPV